MKLSLVGTADTNEKQMCEVGKNLIITSNGDRMKYVDPVSGLSGNAGFDIRKDYWDAPTFNSEVVGELDETKYYSIKVKPVSTFFSDPTTGEFLAGSMTHHTDPIMPSAALKGLRFDMPDLSDQQIVFQAGYADGGTATIMQDTSQDWTEDGWVGNTVINIRNGLIATVTGNSPTELELDADLGWAYDDPYHITTDMCTGFQVFAMEMLDPGQVVAGAAFSLQGVADIGGTFDLETVATGGAATDDAFPPDPYYACVRGDNRVICGGGTYANGNNALVDNEGTTASGVVAPIVVTQAMERAFVITEANLVQVMRYTFGDASQYQPTMRKGSIVTITDSADPLNNLDEGVVLNIAADGSWFEVANDNGVADAGDAAVQMSFTRNVLIGAKPAVEGDFVFRDNMVGANVSFDGDVYSPRIAWVDEVNNEAGLFEKYDGMKYGSKTYDPLPTHSINMPTGYMATARPVGDIVGDVSLCLWFKPSAITANENQIFSIRDLTGSGADITVSLTNSSTELRIKDSDEVNVWNEYRLNSDYDPIMEAGEWHHVAFVRSNSLVSQMSVYIDGVKLSYFSGSGTFDDMSATSGSSIWLSYVLGSGLDNRGAYGSVKLFDTAITEEDIEVIRSGFLCGKETEIWKIDEGSGDSAAGSMGVGQPFLYSSPTWNVPTTGMTWNYEERGDPTVVSDYELSVFNDIGLAWSDYGNPHIFRTENYSEVGDRIMALAVFNQSVIILCAHSLYAVPLTGLGQAPYLISDEVECLAPHSVVTTPSGVFFFDGSGFSMTDGQRIIPVTAYKAGEYLDYLNRNQVINIRGLYDPNYRRVEYSFAYGDQPNNNFGLNITIDSLNCYPVSRNDVNASWMDRNDVGDFVPFHGDNNGQVWEHGLDMGTDGNFTQEMVGKVVSVDEVAGTIVVEFNQEITEDVTEGDTCLFLPETKGSYVPFVIKSFTQASTTTQYTIGTTEGDDIFVGGTVVVGGIPFDYGIRWEDFSSPQYRHKIREVEIDVSNFNGILYVEHYKDLKESKVVGVTKHYVNGYDTKIVSKNRGGDCFQFGFRMFGVSLTRFEIHSYEILFGVEQ